MCEEVRAEKRRKLLKELTIFCYLQEAYWNCSKNSKFPPSTPTKIANSNRFNTFTGMILLLEISISVSHYFSGTLHFPCSMVPTMSIFYATWTHSISYNSIYPGGHLIQGQTNNLCVVFLKRYCLASDIFTLVNMNWETNQWVEIEAKTSWK